MHSSRIWGISSGCRHRMYYSLEKRTDSHPLSVWGTLLIAPLRLNSSTVFFWLLFIFAHPFKQIHLKLITDWPFCEMGKPRGPYRVGIPAKRGCWTCRGKMPDPLLSQDSNRSEDRKVACDQGRPSCRKCVTAGRKCLGYGLRLSWPATKSRRSIEHFVRNDWEVGSGLDHIENVHFINTLTKHVEALYLHPTRLGDSSGVAIAATC